MSVNITVMHNPARRNSDGAEKELNNDASTVVIWHLQASNIKEIRIEVLRRGYKCNKTRLQRNYNLLLFYFIFIVVLLHLYMPWIQCQLEQ